MKFAVQYSRTGNPTEVVDLVEMKTGDLKPDDVLLDVLAAAINPSHLLALSGDYGIQPELPSVPGTEGLGRVVETGSTVTEFRPGDVVMIPPYAGTWRQQGSYQHAISGSNFRPKKKSREGFTDSWPCSWLTRRPPGYCSTQWRASALATGSSRMRPTRR